MKKERNLHAELAKRKYHTPNAFLYWIYQTVNNTKLLGKKYNPHYEIVDKICDGPAFIIWNHQSRRDHAFITHAALPRRVNIVAEYNEFFRSHLHWVFKMNNILPKKVFTNDLVGLRAMTSIIKQGGVVAFSPEGTSSIFGNNQPIVVGTGKFLKHFKVPVYCVDIRGSYLTNNKICEDDRIGEVFIKQYLLFTPEQLAKMSDQEIDDKINLTFKQNDYEWNKTHRIEYKSKGRICTNLHDICYKCPKCGSEFTMIAKGNEIHCTKCGNSATMNDYYDFIPSEGSVIPEDPTKWMEMERMDIIKEIRKDPNYSFSFDCDIGYLPDDHWVKNKDTAEICGKGRVTIDHSGFHFKGEKLGQPYEVNLTYDIIWTLQIVTDLRTFALFCTKEHYLEFRPYERIVGKALILTEEMHRLHVNSWKNFPWYDYMYDIDKK